MIRGPGRTEDGSPPPDSRDEGGYRRHAVYVTVPEAPAETPSPAINGVSGGGAAGARGSGWNDSPLVAAAHERRHRSVGGRSLTESAAGLASLFFHEKRAAPAPIPACTCQRYLTTISPPSGTASNTMRLSRRS